MNMDYNKKKLTINLIKMEIIVCIIVVLIILFGTGFLNIKSINDIYDYFNKYLYIGTFSCVLLTFNLYVLISLFLNKRYKYHEDILLLDEISNDTAKFIDKDGKVYITDIGDYEINKYYNVVCHYDEIVEVNSISNENFDITYKKINFFTNLYTPFLKFEGILYLPYLYLFILLFIYQIIKLDIVLKFYNIIVLFGLLYLWLYDIVYKIKLVDNKYRDDCIVINNIMVFRSIFGLLGFLFFLHLSNKGANDFTKLFLLLFSLMFFMIFLLNFTYLFDNDGIRKIVEKIVKMFPVIFLFIFSFLALIFSIRENNLYTIIFLIIFIALIIYNAIKIIKKRK